MNVKIYITVQRCLHVCLTSPQVANYPKYSASIENSAIHGASVIDRPMLFHIIWNHLENATVIPFSIVHRKWNDVQNGDIQKL